MRLDNNQTPLHQMATT